MTTRPDGPEVEEARRVAITATKRAENARKWLERVQALAYVMVLFVVLSAAKRWVAPLSDGAILIIIIVFGVFMLLSRWEQGD
jgi:hypothetical protein